MTRFVLRQVVSAILLFSIFASAHAADMNKVIRDVFPAGESGFDPAAGDSLYSVTIIQAIFDTLYTYDYLARPSKLVPLAAESLPQITDSGKTYTIKLKKGIYFADDPAFGGKKRELVAEDVVYSLKRMADPKMRSPWVFLVSGKFVGLDEQIDAAKKSGKFDFDKKLPGMEIVDKYTLRFRLTDTDYNLPYVLAHEPTGIVAREVIEKYGESDGRAMANPVGSGPYRLAQWVRSSKIVLEANPNYRGFTWDFVPQDAADQKLVAQMKGKKMPQVGRVEVSVIEEDQARWLAFQNRELDIMNMEGPLAPQAIVDGKIKPELAAKGIRLDRIVDPEISFTYWNFQDPVVGGLTKEKIALRASAMAMSLQRRRGHQGDPQRPGGRSVVSDPAGRRRPRPGLESSIKYDPVAANALLDRFGYKKGADGKRTTPDGKPLVVTLFPVPTRWDASRRAMEEIARCHRVQMDVHKDKFAELLKLEKQCSSHEPPGGVDRGLPRRRQFHAASLRPEYRGEQFRLRQDSGI